MYGDDDEDDHDDSHDDYGCDEEVDNECHQYGFEYVLLCSDLCLMLVVCCRPVL